MLLETDRLILRRFKDEDFADYFSYVADPELNRMMGQGDLTIREAALANFSYLKDRAERSYVIVRKADDKVVGNLNITSFPDFLTKLDFEVLRNKKGGCLSFALSRHFRRQGLMTEAVSAVIDHLFRVEDLDFVQCGCFDFNLPSLSFQKKLGFTYLTSGTILIGEEEFHTVENILWQTTWYDMRQNK